MPIVSGHFADVFPDFKRYLFFPLLCFVALHAVRAYGVDDIDSLSLAPEQLFDAKVMSVSKTQEKLMDSPAAVFVLTGEDVIRSGATSIPEALRMVPGVQVARINASSWAISVRGFNAALENKLLVLVDGRQIYDPLYSGVYWDIQDMVLEDIDRIEVIRGPGASLWGSNAVNGVINIITKKAEDTQGNLLSFTTGNQERAITEERFGGKIGDYGYYRMYGKYLNRTNEETVSDGDAHDAQTNAKGGFRADWKNPNSDRDGFTLQGDVYRNGDGDITSVPLLTAPYAQSFTENIIARGGNMLGRWTHRFDDDSSFSLQTYFDYTAREQYLLDARRQSFDLDAQYNFPVQGRHQLIAGGAFHYTEDSLAGAPTVSFQPADLAMNTESAFIQDKITLSPREWFLTLGSKFEHDFYTGFNIQPNARLQWYPSEEQMVWASVAHAVRTPSRVEHDLSVNTSTLPPSILSPFPTSVILQANSDYGNEDLIAYEAGYRNQITRSVSLDVSAFYNEYGHLRAFQTLPTVFVPAGADPAHNVLPFIVVNNEGGNTHGIETVLNWKAADNLNLSGAYSLLVMQLYAPTVIGIDQARSTNGQSPEHQFNLRASWDIRKDLFFDTSLYYVGSLPAYSIDPYWRLDMRLDYRIMNGLDFSIVGQDLFAPANREFSSRTAIGATLINPGIYGNVTWRY